MENRTILMKRIALMKILLLVLLVLSMSGCAVVHRFGSYYGKVIDTETKQPLEGAAVLAVYRTQSYSVGGSISHYVDAQETLTDKNGEFKIPVNWVWTFRPLQTFESVSFTIFKPGYGCFPNHKGVKVDSMPPHWYLPTDKYVTVELPGLKTREERRNNLFELSINYDIPYKKQKHLFDLRNYEAMQIDKEPWPIPDNGGE